MKLALSALFLATFSLNTMAQILTPAEKAVGVRNCMEKTQYLLESIEDGGRVHNLFALRMVSASEFYPWAVQVRFNDGDSASSSFELSVAAFPQTSEYATRLYQALEDSAGYPADPRADIKTRFCEFLYN